MNHPELGELIFDSEMVSPPREHWWKATGEDVKLCVQYCYHVRLNKVTVYNVSGGLTAISKIDFSPAFRAYLNTYCLLVALRRFAARKHPQHVSEIMANMPEIHAPLSIDNTGVLKSTVQLAEEAEIIRRLRMVPDTTVIGLAIATGMRKDIDQTIKMVKDQMEDNKPLMEELIGEDLVSEICQLV
jgi:hypothetical protein